MDLRNAVCVITGGARGIGLATGHALAAKGAAVTLLDRSFDHPPAGFHCVEADVTDAAQLLRVAEELKPAVWINNAGMARHRWICDYSESEINQMLNVNLKGTILGSQAALQSMRHRRAGHIVNIISTAALKGIPGESVYSATKWGVRGFTLALQEEAAAAGVKVTAVYPGGVRTGFWDTARDQAPPFDLFLQPEQIASAIVAALEQDDTLVTREIVLRAIKDHDFTTT